VLSLKVVELIEEGEEVTPPDGLVYRTHPRSALAHDTRTCFVNRPDLHGVAPEAASHLIAKQIGLRAPEFVLTKRPSLSPPLRGIALVGGILLIFSGGKREN
jgi:hypothetical protein